jgi:hypothetical protein
MEYIIEIIKLIVNNYDKIEYKMFMKESVIVNHISIPAFSLLKKESG